MSTFDLMKKVLYLKKLEKNSGEEVRALQDKNLRKMLNHVYDNSPFYRELYSSHGIRKEHLAEVELKDLPTIDKNILMDNFDDISCTNDFTRSELEQFIAKPGNERKPYKGKYTVIHTSGTTGRFGLFVYSPNDWNMLRAMIIVRSLKLKINPFKRTKIAFLGAIDGNYAGITVSSSSPKSLIDFLPLSVNDPKEKLIEQLNAFQPDVINGYTSGGHFCAVEQLHGNLNISPKQIFSSGESLTDNTAYLVHKAFGIKPYNLYAASESISLGIQQGGEPFMNLFNDFHAYEFENSVTLPDSSLKSGRLILSNLYNYTVPLIRYKMNDDIVYPAEQPADARYQQIYSIAGRKEEELYFLDNGGELRGINPHVLNEFFVPGLEKMQFIQVQRDKLVLKAALAEHSSETVAAIHQRMNEILTANNMDRSVAFEVTVVDDILNDPVTHKFKLVVPCTE